MSLDSHDESSPEKRAAEALEEYLQRRDRGEHIDCEKFLQEHPPEVAEELRRYFEAAGQIDALVVDPDTPRR